jgi:undecaprenyl-diphosphatase
MPLYQAVALAVIQGLTEFLPVSSTAHLALFPWLLHWKDPGLTFDLALHSGTLVAVLVYFRRLWVDLFRGAVGLGQPGDPNVRRNQGLIWFLLLGTLPAAIVGWRFEHAAESQLRQPVVIGAALVLVGLLMWAGERGQQRERSLGQVTFVDALVVGVAQAFSVIPGVSRSGITMTAGLFRGMTRETSAQFSFLLSTPIIAGAALKKGIELRREGLPVEMHLPFLVGTLVAALIGYLVIAALIRFLERHTFKIFIVYRISLGVLILAVGWGLRHA